MSIRVQPKDAERFSAAVRKIVQAAEQANLSAEYGWAVWSEFFTYRLVSTQANFSALANADTDRCSSSRERRARRRLPAI